MKSNGDEGGVDAELQKGKHVMNVKQESNSSKPSSPNAKDLAIEREVPSLTRTERFAMEINSNDHCSIQKNQEDELKSAKAKVGEVREENERLKLLLAQMVKDYQSLRLDFLKILQKEEAKKYNDTSITQQETEEPELVSLSLGRTSSEPKNDENKNSNLINGKEDEILNEGLALGLDCRFELNSTEPQKNPSSEEPNEEEPTEMWPPRKIMKSTARSGDEEILEQTRLKKARVSVRARCDTPTMNDGCQWRKYGQKIAKGNPCPRAYYRCTVSPTCPVRKQVQRWVEDMSILITTYEGTHDHPLPPSATAMASTTSAAASMLQCGPSTSTTSPLLGTSVSAPNSISTFANLQGLNFSFSQNAKPYQFYFPNSSISSSNSHPTVVLDLTAPNTFSHLNRLSSAPRYSSTTCLNFSNPSSTNSFLKPNTPQTSWSSDYSNYGTLSYNKNNIGSLNIGKHQPREDNIYQPYMNKLTPTQGPQQSLTETIAATTKVITSNPNFQSALAAAISSYIGNGGGTEAHQNQGVGEIYGLDNLKRITSESFPGTLATSSADNTGIDCASSFLNKLLSSHPQQQRSISKLPPPLLLWTSNTASGSSAPTKE